MAKKIVFSDLGVAVVPLTVRAFPTAEQQLEAQTAWDEVVAAALKELGGGSHFRVPAAEKARQQHPEIYRRRNEMNSGFHAEVFGVRSCTAGQLFVPPTAKPQTIRVETCVAEHGGEFLPLVDSAGKPVAFEVVPGAVVTIPSAVFSAGYVRFHGEPGAEFSGTIVLRGAETIGGVGKKLEVKTSLPASAAERKREKAIRVAGRKHAQLHVPAGDAEPQQVFVYSCLDDEGEPFQLLDATGQPVAFTAYPGSASPIPPIALEQFCIRFRAVRSDFEAVLVS